MDNVSYQVSRSSVNWFWRRFFKVFTIYGHGGHLGHVMRTVWTIFRSPDPWRLHMKFGYNWPCSFRGEVVWNCGQTTTMDDGRTTDPSHPISSPGAFNSGELKKTRKGLTIILISDYHKNSKNWDIKKWNSLILQCSNVSKRCRWNGKQCRPWSDCSWGAVWSGSALVAQTYFSYNT